MTCNFRPRVADGKRYICSFSAWSFQNEDDDEEGDDDGGDDNDKDNEHEDDK